MFIYNLIPIIAFIGKLSLLSEKTKIPPQIAAPTLSALIILTLYCSAYLGVIFFSTGILYIIGFWAIYDLYKRKIHVDIAGGGALFATIFSICLIILGLYYQGCYLNSQEDLQFWGLFTKELLIRGGVESSSYTSISEEFSYYPRGSAMFHYYYLLPTGYYDGGALFAHLLLATCFLLPLLNGPNYNKYNSGIYIVISLTICALSTYFLRSLDSDAILGLAGVSLILIYLNSNHDDEYFIFNLYPVVAIMPLLAPYSLFFSFICILMILVAHYKESNVDIFKLTKQNSKYYIALFLPFASYGLCIFLYSIFGRNIDKIADQPYYFSIYDLVEILFFAQILLIACFKEAVILSIVLVYLCYKWTEGEDLKLHRSYLIWLSMIIMAVIFVALIGLILYFGKYETLSVGRVLRYFAPYIIVTSILSLYFISKTSIERKKQVTIYILMLLSVACFLNNLNLVSNIISLEEKSANKQIQEIQDLIQANKKVTFSFENKSSNDNCYDFAYKMAPFIDINEIKKCLAEKIEFHNVYLGRYNSTPSEIKDGCRIIFKPFLLKYEIICD